MLWTVVVVNPGTKTIESKTGRIDEKDDNIVPTMERGQPPGEGSVTLESSGSPNSGE